MNSANPPESKTTGIMVLATAYLLAALALLLLGFKMPSGGVTGRGLGRMDGWDSFLFVVSGGWLPLYARVTAKPIFAYLFALLPAFAAVGLWLRWKWGWWLASLLACLTWFCWVMVLLFDVFLLLGVFRGSGALQHLPQVFVALIGVAAIFGFWSWAVWYLTRDRTRDLFGVRKV